VPEVSVIIPAYNAARFIGEALQSVLQQTFQDFEIIVVDDGSTDDTARVVAGIADPRIRYVYQENKGLAGARNHGLRLAQGTFVAFLDADDLWHPMFLERCVTYLRLYPDWAVVYTWATFVDQNNRTLPQGFRAKLVGKVLCERLREGNVFPIHAALSRARVIKTVGMFDETLSALEDWDLWLRVTSRYQIGCLPECLARYRLAGESLSASLDRMQTARFAVLYKHFGPLDGDRRLWSVEKRQAYGFALRQSALGLFEAGREEEGWTHLADALSVWPVLLERVDTFYELLCWDQPRGYRGNARALDLERNERRVRTWLMQFFHRNGIPMHIRRRAQGALALALAMLNDQAGDWSAARRHILRAVCFNPLLLLSPVNLRRLLKLCLGQRIAKIVKASMTRL